MNRMVTVHLPFTFLKFVFAIAGETSSIIKLTFGVCLGNISPKALLTKIAAPFISWGKLDEQVIGTLISLAPPVVSGP